MLRQIVTFPSVQVSIGAMVVLTAASVARPLPWWLWAVVGSLGVVAVGQAVRDAR